MTGPRHQPRQPHLPRVARWLLRLAPVADAARDDVEADLHELFVRRRRDRGRVAAHCRLYHDLASLWRPSRPRVPAHHRRSPIAFLSDVRVDLRYAARLFVRQPAILLLTIAGLSLGLGIATAAFSITNAAFRGEGLVDPDRAPGVLRTTDRSVSTNWNYDEFLHLRKGATGIQLEAVLTEAALVRTSAAEDNAPSARVAFVSDGFFGATGGRVALGRPLDAAAGPDVAQGGSPPVVVSHVFWTSRLNRDPAIVGRTIWIGRTAATIVGVAERGFSLPHNRLLWMPLSAYGAVHTATPVTPGDIPVEVFGRLAPDVTPAQAEAQLSGVAASLPQSPIAGDSALRVRLDPGAGLGRMSSADALGITMSVFAVIALVLLLACANVATVLISTAITREREMGVRAALGASRPRIVRQLITESLALGAVAATLGLLFASWSIPAIGTMIEAPADADLAPDFIVYVFLGAAALVVGAGAGLAPAWHGRGVDLVTPLKGSEAASQRRLAPRRLRSALVMTQAAASVLLIVLATLFVRATFRTAAIDVGFDAADLYALSTGFGEASGPGGARARGFWARAMTEVRAMPGITAAALVEMTPFDGTTRSSVTGAGPAAVVTYFNRTDAEFFETIGLRILAGRAFSSDEAAARAPVAVVSESLARAYWRDGSPLGQVLPPDIAIPAISPSSRRPVVVGVVADAITSRLHERNAFAVYEPIDPATDPSAQLLIRAAPDATGAIERASGRLRAIDPQVDVRIASVAARLQQEAARPRMLAMLTGIIGAIAVVLCVIGLYGLTASVVGQRTREMGVRAAMGAASADLLRLLLWDSLRPVVIGLALGVGTALAVSRVLEAAMFFGVSPQDPMAFAVGAAVLLGAATLAVLVPTRRAAAVDAAVVLRRS